MTTTTGPVSGLDPATVRGDFPILAREVHGRPLVYLDSANTSQKPRQVLDAMADYYERHNANVHRAVHTLSEEATHLFEQARGKVARFVGASERATVFTKNASEAINLVAYAWGLRQLREGDEVLVTEMEHHSNLVPWHLVAGLTGARVRAIPVTGDHLLDLDALDGLLTGRTRMVAVSAMSNVLGTLNPVRAIAERAHAAGALVLADAAQAVPHAGARLDELGVDFLAFTGHKMLGPMGVGVLAAREAVLERMEPFLGGGEMIRDVTIEGSTWNDVPWRFEAGTPNVAEAVGLGAAVEYLQAIGMDRVRAAEADLTAYALKRLGEVQGLRLYGPAELEHRGGVVSFTLGEVHPHDVAQVLDSEGVAVRAGHHCTMPLHRRLGLQATTRASFSVYSTTDEVDALAAGLDKARRFFA
jgi:cysteine desulfurase / selenocysteine lyase